MRVIDMRWRFRISVILIVFGVIEDERMEERIN